MVGWQCVVGPKSWAVILGILCDSKVHVIGWRRLDGMVLGLWIMYYGDFPGQEMNPISRCGECYGKASVTLPCVLQGQGLLLPSKQT